MLKTMRDKGLDKGLIREFESSKRELRGQTKNFFGFRKMFWDYLKKLHVPFYDECCPTAVEEEGMYPVRYNSLLARVEYFNGTDWADITALEETTTTTTTSSTTTTTTTAP